MDYNYLSHCTLAPPPSSLPQLCGFVESNAKLFASALESSGPESKVCGVSVSVSAVSSCCVGCVAALSLVCGA